MKDIVPYELDNVRIRYYADNSASGYARGIDLKLNGDFIKGIESWASISVMQTAEDIKNDQYTLYTALFTDTIVQTPVRYEQTIDSGIIYPGLHTSTNRSTGKFCPDISRLFTAL